MMSSSSSSPDDEPWPATSQCLTVQESPCLMYHHCPRHQGSQAGRVVLGAIRNLTSRSRNAHFFSASGSNRGTGPWRGSHGNETTTTTTNNSSGAAAGAVKGLFYHGGTQGPTHLPLFCFLAMNSPSVGLTQRQEKCKPPATAAAAVMVRYQGT